MPGMTGRTGAGRRPRAHVRQRGSSFQVLVYAGVDPLTGKDARLSGTARTAREAEKLRTRLLAHVDEQRSASTRATLGYVLDAWLRVHEVEESTRENYRWYVEQVIRPALGRVPLAKVSARMLEELYAELRRCRARCDGKPYVEHRTSRPHACRAVRHKWGSGRPSAADRRNHDCVTAGCVTVECPQHVCKPMAAASVRQVHAVLSSALGLAVRWEWLGSNPAAGARQPRRTAPQPRPPTPDEAARILAAAWEQDESWGTLVWLVMVTGMRRGELAALRWHDVHLDSSVLEIRRAYGRRGGKAVEKATKTHQMRRIALDEDTAGLLTAHRGRYEDRARALDVEPDDQAFVFSYEADHSRPCSPDAISHRYGRMCSGLGVESHLHAMRHYSATELIAAGVDVRTVAGRLGHGGGGTTTLRVYAAWVAESDKRAADILAGRMRPPAAAGGGRGR